MDSEEATGPSGELGVIAVLIDPATGKATSAMLDEAARRLDAFMSSEPPAPYVAVGHYFRANLHSHRAAMTGEMEEWSIERPNWRAGIRELREALRHKGFDPLPNDLKAPIYTNLANKLREANRFIEANAYFDRALEIVPKFGKSLGNKAGILSTYAYGTSHPMHWVHIQRISCDLYRQAIYEGRGYEPEDEEQVKATYRDRLEKIEGFIQVSGLGHLEYEGRNFGRSHVEHRYRKWAVDNRLFLNELNDATKDAVSAEDTLMLPPFVAGIGDGDPPLIVGLFNQLIQEYVSARFFLFEGVDRPRSFADKGVGLSDTLDYSLHGISTERIRVSFRLAYSLFDKIAFFLNEYFAVGLGEKAVNFSAIWTKKDAQKRVLTDRPNGFLHALYWISKDLGSESYDGLTDPEAEVMADVRHALEHRYLQIHFERFYMSPKGGKRFSMELGDFQRLTLRILRLARAALIYTAFAMKAEEEDRAKGKEGKLIVEQTIDPYRRPDYL